MVSLGSLLADVPHTRPAPVTGSASEPKLVEALGLSASRYEGPTGIVGVLHDVCRQSDIPSVSLWAAVPHYVSLTPNPRAAGALRLARSASRGRAGHVGLDEGIRTYTDQVSEAAASDPDTAAYVEELEQRVDDAEEEEIEIRPETRCP